MLCASRETTHGWFNDPSVSYNRIVGANTRKMAGSLDWTLNVDATLSCVTRLGPSGPESKRGRRKLDAKIRANYAYNSLFLTPIQRRQMTDANLVLVDAMNYIGFCLRIVAGGIPCQPSAKHWIRRQASFCLRKCALRVRKLTCAYASLRE